MEIKFYCFYFDKPGYRVTYSVYPAEKEGFYKRVEYSSYGNGDDKKDEYPIAGLENTIDSILSELIDNQVHLYTTELEIDRKEFMEVCLEGKKELIRILYTDIIRDYSTGHREFIIIADDMKYNRSISPMDIQGWILKTGEHPVINFKHRFNEFFIQMEHLYRGR